MIFLDTSAIYALADRDDAYHAVAVQMLERAIRDGEQLLIHSYILAEAAALLQRRLSPQIALGFLEEAAQFHIVWIDEAVHNAAVKQLKKAKAAKLSLVDVVSFQVMEREGLRHYLGFDKHFADRGLSPYSS